MEKEKEKDTMKGSEDLKPQDDQVLLEDNDGVIKVKFEGNDEFMPLEDAIEYLDSLEDVVAIDEFENEPFDLSELVGTTDTAALEALRDYEDLLDYEQDIVDALMDTGEFDIVDAMEILNNGDFDFYPDVDDDASLGYAIIDSIGSLTDAVSKENLAFYVDEEKLRDKLEWDVDDYLSETARDEVDYEHRFDDPDSFDFDEEVEKWIEDHREETLNMWVDEALDGEFGTDILEDCFDYDRFGYDVAMERSVYFTDKGAIMLY